MDGLARGTAVFLDNGDHGGGTQTPEHLIRLRSNSSTSRGPRNLKHRTTGKWLREPALAHRGITGNGSRQNCTTGSM